MSNLSLAGLTDRATELASTGGRAILGITGPPGAGKTTLAAALIEQLRARNINVAHVPMDGFHLADATLREHGTLGRKGTIETFDAHGYLALLGRLRTELDHDVFAPDFERDLEQPLAAAITVPPYVRLVVTEGNYLLDQLDPWPLVRHALDEIWFVDVPDDVRIGRLLRRHVQFGKSVDEARTWVDRVDEPNAQRIIAQRDAADLVVDG